MLATIAAKNEQISISEDGTWFDGKALRFINSKDTHKCA